MEFPEMNLKTKLESPASPDVTTNSMMTEQQKKAVIEIVRRSLNGLCNDAPSLEDEAKMFLQACPFKSNVRSQSKEIKKLGDGKKALESSCET